MWNHESFVKRSRIGQYPKFPCFSLATPSFLPRFSPDCCCCNIKLCCIVKLHCKIAMNYTALNHKVQKHEDKNLMGAENLAIVVNNHFLFLLPLSFFERICWPSKHFIKWFKPKEQKSRSWNDIDQCSWIWGRRAENWLKLFLHRFDATSQYLPSTSCSLAPRSQEWTHCQRI